MLRRILKILSYSIAAILSIAIIVGTSIFFYKKNELLKELSFATADKCKPYDINNFTQLCSGLDGEQYFRRVDLDKREFIVSKISQDGRYAYHSYWAYECDLDSTIETDRKFSSGESIELKCANNPYDPESTETYLTLGVTYGEKVNYSFSYGGFSIEQNFLHTDYEPLERQHTLSNAKTIEQIAAEEKQRLIEEEKEKLAKQEALALEEKLKLQRLAEQQKRNKELAEKNEKIAQCNALYRNRRDAAISSAKNTLEVYAELESNLYEKYIIFKNQTKYQINNFEFYTGKMINNKCATSGVIRKNNSPIRSNSLQRRNSKYEVESDINSFNFCISVADVEIDYPDSLCYLQ